jgi:hypothetical protein
VDLLITHKSQGRRGVYDGSARSRFNTARLTAPLVKSSSKKIAIEASLRIPYRLHKAPEDAKNVERISGIEFQTCWELNTVTANFSFSQ